MNSKRFAGQARKGRAAVYLLTGLALGSATSAFAQDQGATKAEEVDVIVVTGSLPIVTPALTGQLKVGGRLAAIVGEEPAMVARIITRATEDGFDVLNLFETHVKPLRNAPRPSSFKF